MFLTCVPVRLKKLFFFFLRAEGKQQPQKHRASGSLIFQARGCKLAYPSGFCLIGAARSAATGGQTVYCSFTSLGKIRWWFLSVVSSHIFSCHGET